MARARPAIAVLLGHRHVAAKSGLLTLSLRGSIRANLDVFARVPSAKPQAAAAVALVVMNGEDGEPAVPVFLRTSGRVRHSGQMALPGGRLDGDELPEECAIRELQEELGLAVDAGDVLGSLDDFDTRSGFTITPVVIWSGAAAGVITPSAAEVAHLYVVSIAELRSAVNQAKPGASEAFCLGFRWGQVFAPTAAILYQFSEVALDGRPCRVADFYQPPFARR